MRIVVVEDEITILNGILNLIRRIDPSYEIVATAEDGAEGLEKICEYRPALVITDIVMPQMNGIEMIRRAKQRGVKAEYVLLSGHNDFSFAQQAIGMGVCEYLLKPLTRSAIENVLEKVELLIAQKNAPEDMDDFSMTARERTLYLQMQGNPDKLGIHGPVWPILICFDERPGNESIECIRQTFRVYNVFNQTDLCLIPTRDACCIQALVLHTEDKPFADMRMHMNHITGALLRACPKISFMLIHPGIEAAELTAACEALQRLGVWRIQLAGRDDRRIYWTEELPAQTAPITGLMQAANNICAALQVYDFSAALNTIDGVSDMIAGGFYRCDQLQQALSFIAMGIQSIAEEYPIRWQEQIESLIYAPRILQSMRDSIEVLRVHSEERHGNNPLIARVFELSQRQYDQPLNLDILAQQINISPKYLGQLFIDETGMKYSAYLHELRIRKARALLEQTAMSITQIANAVGFPDDKYFQRIFKEKVGMSPGSYARLYRPK